MGRDFLRAQQILEQSTGDVGVCLTDTDDAVLIGADATFADTVLYKPAEICVYDSWLFVFCLLPSASSPTIQAIAIATGSCV